MGLDLLKYGATPLGLLLIVLWDSYDNGALLQAIFAAVAGALLGVLWAAVQYEKHRNE